MWDGESQEEKGLSDAPPEKPGSCFLKDGDLV